VPSAIAESDSSVSKTVSSAPDITCQTAVLIDASTGGVLYNKAMHEQMFPASITKILTGIVAVKLGKPEDLITVSQNDVVSSNDASIALSNGEQITQEQALYAMFLASANDAALALAEHNGGTIENFANLMNKEATADGALNSNFSNPDGLPDINNYTTAYDMAMITKTALNIPEVMSCLSTFTYTIAPTNLQPEKRQLWTLHKMMKDTVYYDKDVIAGKTGWETMSGHTLVTVAQRGDMKLICVAMKSTTPYSIYSDTKKLLDYGFNNYSVIQQVFEVQTDTINAVKPQQSVKVITNTEKTASEGTPNKYMLIAFTIFIIAIIGIASFYILEKAVISSVNRQKKSELNP